MVSDGTWRLWSGNSWRTYDQASCGADIGVVQAGTLVLFIMYESKWMD